MNLRPPLYNRGASPALSYRGIRANGRCLWPNDKAVRAAIAKDGYGAKRRADPSREGRQAQPRFARGAFSFQGKKLESSGSYNVRLIDAPALAS